MAGTVLVVDDSREARNSIMAPLRGIFNSFLEAADGVEAIKAFVEEKPGFIITDIEMPSIDGYRFISTIRNMADGRDVPIIMLSGRKDSLTKKLKGFDSGASDFIMKPFAPEELVARVKCLLRMRSLMDELKEKNARLKKLATTDELTGLYNRRHFFEKVNEAMALGLRHNFKIACLLMDIDHFKKVNDTAGHIAGDEVLKKLGRLLLSCKREGEIIARFGGEEFVMCLFNTDSRSAFLAAERFRNLIRAYDFSSPVCPPTQITASMGLAIYPQGGVISIDELVKAADKALYKSKREGRDKVTVYEWGPSMDKQEDPSGPGSPDLEDDVAERH